VKREDGLVPDVKGQFVFIKDIVLIVGKRDNGKYGYCISLMWWVIKIV
jgi:hypothetical protein